jgi:hypothetical protein
MLRHTKQLISVTTTAQVTEERCFLCGPGGYRPHPTTEGLLKAVFPVWSVPRLYNEGQLPELAVREREEVSNVRQ